MGNSKVGGAIRYRKEEDIASALRATEDNPITLMTNERNQITCYSISEKILLDATCQQISSKFAISNTWKPI